jgi:hypothetical protein
MTSTLTVVAHFIMNELFQLRPVLLIEAGNVVSVDVGEVGFNHGIVDIVYICHQRNNERLWPSSVHS